MFAFFSTEKTYLKPNLDNAVEWLKKKEKTLIIYASANLKG